MAITFLINSLVWGAAALLTARYCRRETIPYRLLAMAIFFYAQIILSQIVWGLLGKLYLQNIAASAAIFFFICLFFFRNRLFNLETVKKIGFADDLKYFLGEAIQNKISLFCLSVLLGFAIVKLSINLVNPPFGWDSLNYHFGFPAQWLKQGNLLTPITINDDLAPSYYPVNGSLIYLWLMLPLKNAFLADVGQIPFFLISFLALYGICRRVSVSRRYSLYAAILFSSIPNYFKQMEIAYVDVMVCAWFLVSAYFLFAFYQSKKLRDVVLFSISAGLLLGTKTLALLYSVLLLGFFILFLVITLRDCFAPTGPAMTEKEPFKSIKLRKAQGIAVYLIISFCIICIFGGYGYIRNYIQTGNPIYPMEVRLREKEVFKGVYDKTNYSVRVSRKDYSFEKLLFHEGLGGGVLLFLIPGLLYFPAGIFRKRIGMDKLLLFSTPVLLYLLWRYGIPLANARYLYPALALGFVAPFYFLPGTKKIENIVGIFVAMCVLASVSELASRAELIASFIMAIILFFTLRYILTALSRAKAWQWGIITGILFLGLFFLNIDYNRNEFKRYLKMTWYSGLWPDAASAWQWLNENTSANNIAYVGRPVPFPLYGTNLRNNVFYVSVNKVDPVMIHYFPSSRYHWGEDFTELHKNLEAEGNYREHADYEVWLSNLKRRKAEYLFIYSLHQTKEVVFPWEDLWAVGNPDIFVQQFSNPTIHIYKLRW